MQITDNSLIETLAKIIDDLDRYQWSDFLGEKPPQWERGRNLMSYKIFRNIENLLNDPCKMLHCYAQIKYGLKEPTDEPLLHYFLLEDIFDENPQNENTPKFFQNVVTKLKNLIAVRHR